MSVSPLSQRLKSPVGRLRLMGYLEGVSLLLLVGIAVPIKYLGHEPLWVEILGPIHGVGFIIYCLCLGECVLRGGWTFFEIAKVFVAAFIPFGFLFVRRLLIGKDAGLTIKS